ncbi:hypothetical protein TrLO_g4657 [Triparma laevis f. longispina]|uniref:Uncharacterized protein n=1 Tax=Triparma laevis f. longispina TaxID=1714387 RepID=A0A9W7CP61_9STRA|nr:hypothetical protein TrLO_g4657 [Triparma laevis f. longispina]
MLTKTVLTYSALLGAVSAAYLRGFLQISYDSQTAKEKFDYLFDQISSDNSPGSWPPTVGWPPASALPYIFIESMKPTVSEVTDVMPDGRYKLIHSVGGAAGVKLELEENPYTGLFQQAEYGLIRFASAKEPKEGADVGALDGGFTPGMGIKFLRDNQPSANIVFLHKLTAQDSWNFFKNTQSNHLSVGGLGTAENLLKKKFETSGSNWVNMVGLSDMARYAEDGSEVSDEDIKFPFQLLLIPTDEMASKFPDEYEKPLIEQLRTIGSGTTLYELHAKEDYDAAPVLIGRLTTTSTIESSVFADSKLFLKHQIMEEDFALRPEWTERCASNDDCPICPVDARC